MFKYNHMIILLLKEFIKKKKSFHGDQQSDSTAKTTLKASLEGGQWSHRLCSNHCGRDLPHRGCGRS